MKQKRLFLMMASLLWVGALGASSAWAEDASSASSSSDQPLQPSSAAVPNPQNAIPATYDAGGVPTVSGRQQYPFYRTGGVNLFADVATDYGYDDNVTQANAATAASSSFLAVRPTIAAQAQYRADTYALAYKGDFRRYPDFDANNTNAHSLLLNAQNVFTGRASLAWAAAYSDIHDPIGSTDRSTNAKSPDHHRDLSLNGTFGYGAQDARGRVEFDGGVGSKRFLNNHDSTEGSDVDNANMAARFLYRVAPKTRVLTEVSRTKYDYQHDTSLMTNTDYRYYLGARWEATAATTGSIKLGAQSKEFESSARKDYSGFAWEASIRWQPLTYSTFELLAGRAATDSSGSNVDYVMTQNNTLTWRHDWTTYVHSRAGIGYQKSHYVGSDRNDRQNSYSAALMYDMRRWLGIGVQYDYTRRSSTTDTYDYLRHLTMLKLEASF